MQYVLVNDAAQFWHADSYRWWPELDTATIFSQEDKDGPAVCPQGVRFVTLEEAKEIHWLENVKPMYDDFNPGSTG